MTRIKCKEFRKRSWDEAIAEAETFVSGLPRERLISVSHVSEPPYGIVFVWYVDELPDNGPGQKKR